MYSHIGLMSVWDSCHEGDSRSLVLYSQGLCLQSCVEAVRCSLYRLYDNTVSLKSLRHIHSTASELCFAVVESWVRDLVVLRVLEPVFTLFQLQAAGPVIT